MSKFHNGQTVEVTVSKAPWIGSIWRKAKIAHLAKSNDAGTIAWYDVEFIEDGKHAAFDSSHIRAVSP